MDILDTITQIILILLSLSTLIGVADYVGLLPKRIRRWLKLNQMARELAILQEMGIDIEQYKRANIRLKYPKKFAGQDIKEVTRNAISQYKITKRISVGHQRPTEVQCYYDVIGATCRETTARYFADILSTYWALKMRGEDKISKYEYDFIVTPKSGSPILGYEFSKLVKKPFLLHEDSPRFRADEDMRTVFNCAAVPDKGSVGLIVDDSTTGGSMVCSTIDDLKSYGYQVHTCLVVFEPKNKNARERLAEKNVELISVIETHNK